MRMTDAAYKGARTIAGKPCMLGEPVETEELMIPRVRDVPSFYYEGDIRFLVFVESQGQV